MKPHIHAALIKQWADGAEIEWLDGDGIWAVTKNPAWDKGIHYRIKDPYRELKEAAADPTKEVGILLEGGTAVFYAFGTHFDWGLEPDQYAIRDKPKTKVTMWQWIYQSGNGVYITQGFHAEAPSRATRKIIGPAPWTEIEVEA